MNEFTDPAVSPNASIFLGCAIGERMAVRAYDSPDHPALVRRW